jgi:hypothetical protein
MNDSIGVGSGENVFVSCIIIASTKFLGMGRSDKWRMHHEDHQGGQKSKGTPKSTLIEIARAGDDAAQLKLWAAIGRRTKHRSSRQIGARWKHPAQRDVISGGGHPGREAFQQRTPMLAPTGER